MLFLIKQQTVKTIVAITKTKRSIKITELTFIGEIVPTAPKINDVLIIFEPTTIPSAISFSPFSAATI